MKPTPFTTAFPQLAAEIDAARPLISAALLDIRVTDIGDFTVNADVITQHSYDILTRQTQFDYLNQALSTHWQKTAGFFFKFQPETAPVNPDIVTPALASAIAQEPVKRTSNALTFLERQLLQHWMQQPDNAAYVAKESDASAAGKATLDIAEAKPSECPLFITAGNIQSMRKLLGIEKIKLTKAPESPELIQIPLADLQARLSVHEERLDTLTVQGTGMQATIADLHRVLTEIIKCLSTPSDTVCPPLPAIAPLALSTEH